MEQSARGTPDVHSFPPLRDCWYLTGPTASGKTAVGLELAERLDAEIVSLDSMAVYRGMDIGTAKPTAAEQARIPHHLIDIVEPTADYSVPQFVEQAHRVVQEIRARGRTPLFVGGTPLYLKALLRGVYPGPPADWEFRREIEAELQTTSVAALHQRLQQVDPLSAARLHPHDRRRIIRALEVYRHTGQPISHRQLQFEEVPSEPCEVVVLQWARPELHRRIKLRVRGMFANGLVDEVRGLLQRHGELGRTASQAVGYREVMALLANGQKPAEICEKVEQRTRQFARRQETWFRSLPECQPLPVSPGFAAKEVAQQILARAR